MPRVHRLVWTRSATRDYEAILDYMVERDGVLAARRLDEKLDEEILALRTVPKRCRIVPELKAEGIETYRELIVKPYRVVFRLQGRQVILLAVLDGRRDLQEILVRRALED